MTEEKDLIPFRTESVFNDDTPAEMVWVDLETTGLIADEEYILEIGIMVTDKYGREKASFQSLVYDSGLEMRLNELELGRFKGDAFVHEMHTKNNLLKELRELGNLPYKSRKDFFHEGVQSAALNFLHKYAGESGQLPLTGSTINFDRAFLGEYMDRLHDWFHYRNIDVTTLKNLCKMLNPGVYAGLREDPGKVTGHRAISDIRDSIRDYNFYRQNFLFES